MTREEAREFLLSIANKLGYIGVEDLTDRDGKRMIEAIKALEEPQWIPCSEITNLPEYEVLCCDMRGEMIVGYLDRNDDSNTGWWADSDGVCLMDVVAYMPLPEPWKEDAE